MNVLIDVLEIKKEQLERRINELDTQIDGFEEPNSEVENNIFKVFDYGRDNGEQQGLTEALEIVKSTLNYIRNNK